MLTFYFYIIFKLKFCQKSFIFTPLTAVINCGNTVLIKGAERKFTLKCIENIPDIPALPLTTLYCYSISCFITAKYQKLMPIYLKEKPNWIKNGEKNVETAVIVSAKCILIFELYLKCHQKIDTLKFFIIWVV